MTDETATPAQAATPARTGDPRPWPRYFARTLDTVLLGAIGMVLLAIPLVVLGIDPEPMFGATAGFGGMFVSALLAFVLAMPLIGVLVAFAQTPGKWLFGIRVRDPGGRRLSLRKALLREGWVLVRGVGLGIPVVTLFTHIASYTDLKEEGATVWDRRLDCRVLHAPATPWWWVRAVLGGILVVALTLWTYIDIVRSLGA